MFIVSKEQRWRGLIVHTILVLRDSTGIASIVS